MKRLGYLWLLPVLTIMTGMPVEAGETSVAMVQRLYEQVVARHPLGIPFGADEAAFAPYISTGLRKRFDRHEACINDWFRQNPGPDLKPPGVFEDGIFSGGSERAEPTAFAIGKVEAKARGATSVHVRLTWQDDANAPFSWYVAAVIVRENGRPVVDDILFLKDDDRRVDYRLSAQLASGCEGPRWVGQRR